jgi:hypothetical protein
MNPHSRKRLEIVPFVTIPVGWMPCIACSDFKTQPGRMWLGYSRTGEDLTIECPVCHGTAVVERLKHLDARTGQEIDYERPGQTFVRAEGLPHGQVLFMPPDDLSARASRA